MVIHIKKGMRRFISILFTLSLIVILILTGIKTYDFVQRKIYPMEYTELVEKYSSEYELDPLLVYAVIKTESNFKEDAVSNVGARGLMQMMPDTFDWVNTKLKNKDIDFDDMYTPNTNLKYSCYLLQYLVNEFGDIETAIAAYHAGRTAVNKWLNDDSYSNNGENLHTIPIDDTDHYVNKVMNNYDKYKKLYSE